MKCVSICRMCSARGHCLIKNCTKKFLFKVCPEAQNHINHLATALNLQGSERHRIPQKQLKSFVQDHNN